MLTLRKLLPVLALLIWGCSVEKSPTSGGLPEGSLKVTALDSLGEPVAGAIIRLDGVERNERTPAWLYGVLEGAHTVEVEQFGFWPVAQSVTVTGGEANTVELTLEVVPADQEGFIDFRSNPPGARLLQGGRTFLVNGLPVTSPATVPVFWGRRAFSAHLEGHATASPIMPELAITAGNTVTLQFELTALPAAKQVGSLPFDFTLENSGGDSIRLSDLTGDVVLLNFWYLECAPCLAEFPGIEQVYQDYRDDGFRVVALDPMNRDNREEVEAFRRSFGVGFQLLLDWQSRITYNVYRISAFPANIFIDRQGRIHAIRGGLTQEELEAYVVELLGAGKLNRQFQSFPMEI